MTHTLNKAARPITRPLSSIHRQLHKGSVDAARRMRYDGAAHARLLELAKASRVYFAHFKSQND